MDVLRDEWRWIMYVVLAAVAVTSVYVFAVTPTYRTNALVQVERPEPGSSLIEGVSSMLVGETPTEAEMQILGSRFVLSRAIERERLNIEVSPRYFPLIGGALARSYGGRGAADPRLGLESYAWGGERLRVERLEVPTRLEGQELRVVAGAGGEYALHELDGDLILRGSVGETSAEGGIVILVSELAARPRTEFAVTWHRTTDVLARLQSRLSISERGRQSGIIELALEGSEPDEIVRTLDTISDVYVRQNIDRRSEEAARMLDFLNEQLPELRAELDAAEEALNRYRVTEASVDLDLRAQALLDQLTELERRLSEVSLERVARSQRFTSEHPAMRVLFQQEQELELALARLDRQARGLPEAEQEMLRLLRDVRVADELYLLLLNRAQELRVMQVGTIGNVRVIDEALPPLNPVKPNRMLALLVAVGLGGVAGGGAVYLRHLLDNTISDPRVLEQRFGLPVYAIVPRCQAEARSTRSNANSQGIVALDHAGEPAVESLRSLRTSIEILLQDAANPVLAFTSAQPAAGKSFISTNLAALIAQLGRKVLVVDADLRRGHLHRRFGLSRSPGLAELIAGDVQVEDAVRSAGHENLSLLLSGELPPQPAELIASPRFEKLLSDLTQRYDTIVLDAPPVLAAAEAITISRLAGVVLLLVRSGKQSGREVELALEWLRQAGAGPRGFIFNDLAGTSKRYGYMAYRYYGGYGAQ